MLATESQQPRASKFQFGIARAKPSRAIETKRTTSRLVIDLAIGFTGAVLLGFGEKLFHTAAYFVVPLLCIPFLRRAWDARRSAVVLSLTLVGSGIGAATRSNIWDSMTEGIELFSYGAVACTGFFLFERARKARSMAITAADRDALVLEHLRTFSREVSHEIRTPITISRGFVEMIGERATDKTMKSDASKALQELDRLARLVDRLVVVTASNDPNFLVRRPTDIEELVSNTVSRWSAVRTRKWTLDFGVVQQEFDGTRKQKPHQSSDDPIFPLDEERISAALDCLLENAMLATNDGDEIALTLEVATDCAHLSVRDNGCGMSKEQVDNLLTEGINAFRDRRPGGTGLGLNVVSSVVRAHGGTIKIDSKERQGSIFTLCLPRTVSTHGTIYDDL